MHYIIFLLNSIFASFHHIFWSSWLKINFCAAMLGKHCSTYLTTLQVLYVFFLLFQYIFQFLFLITFNFYEYFCGFYIYFYAHVAKHFVVVHILQRLIRCDTYVFKTDAFFCLSPLGQALTKKKFLLI